MNRPDTSAPVRDALGGSLAARGKQHPNRELQVLTGELERAANAIIAKYPNSRSATLPLLFLAQAKDGHLTEEGMRDVAQLLGLTPADVLASASFYTMFKKQSQGRYLISVCRNISCTHLGSRKVVAALQDRLGVVAGETTADGTFTLETAECLGTCDGAPAMQVNYEDFYRVTPEQAVELVDKLGNGEEVHNFRGQRVQTAREISYEIAVTGAYRPQKKSDAPAALEAVEAKPESPAAQAEGPTTHVGDLDDAHREKHAVPAEEREEGARLVGGVTLPPDLAPGWRPRVDGDDGSEEARRDG